MIIEPDRALRASVQTLVLGPIKIEANRKYNSRSVRRNPSDDDTGTFLVLKESFVGRARGVTAHSLVELSNLSRLFRGGIGASGNASTDEVIGRPGDLRLGDTPYRKCTSKKWQALDLFVHTNLVFQLKVLSLGFHDARKYSIVQLLYAFSSKNQV